MGLKKGKILRFAQNDRGGGDLLFKIIIFSIAISANMIVWYEVLGMRFLWAAMMLIMII